ncbi:MAG: glycoside hydrolase family 1 protein [Chloroflexota bacterium]|nr:glycoside hydrolase family 1 protein [Chloroflexota bacterium]
MHTGPILFPEGFLWGTATASHQVEGGNRNNDWWECEQQIGYIVDGSRSGAAVEWWSGRAEEDLHRAAAMGHNAHRLSLEWSRLEPSPGVFDVAAFERYREILGTLRDLGMSASVTLYHFSLPQWAAAMGGWRDRSLPEYFARYAAKCVSRLGDLVGWWATINEPMILVYMAYAGDRWPPGTDSLRDGLKAAANIMRAHHLAYGEAKARRPQARIGIVLNLPVIDPSSSTVLNRAVAAAQDWVMNGMVLRVFESGTLAPPLSGRPEPLPGGPNATDWYGINYYGRHVVQFDPTQPADLFGRQVQDGVRSELNNWGEIYPEGLTRGLKRLATFNKPLFVTENGIFDNQDTRRPAYLLRHIRAIHDALQQGLDVRGYFHWTLVDNFEWAEGWSTPFGLLEVNPATQVRRPRRSAHIYHEVIQANGITPELWDAEVGRPAFRE